MSEEAVRQNILVEQGASFTDQYQLLENDGSVININGDTFIGTIKEAPESTTVIATISGTIVDGPNGKFKMTMTSTITAGIAVDNSGDCKIKKTCYVYEYRRIKANGEEEKLSYGRLDVRPEISS